MKDFFEALLVSGKGAIITPVAVLMIVSLLPIVAVDYAIRKVRREI